MINTLVIGKSVTLYRFERWYFNRRLHPRRETSIFKRNVYNLEKIFFFFFETRKRIGHVNFFGRKKKKKKNIVIACSKMGKNLKLNTRIRLCIFIGRTDEDE